MTEKISRPQPLAEPNIAYLKQAVEAWLRAIEGPGLPGRKEDEELVEAAVEAFYGPVIWKYINKMIADD